MSLPSGCSCDPSDPHPASEVSIFVTSGWDQAPSITGEPLQEVDEARASPRSFRAVVSADAEPATTVWHCSRSDRITKGRKTPVKPPKTYSRSPQYNLAPRGMTDANKREGILNVTSNIEGLIYDK